MYTYMYMYTCTCIYMYMYMYMYMYLKGLFDSLNKESNSGGAGSFVELQIIGSVQDLT